MSGAPFPIAAVRAAQRKFGAQHIYYDQWYRADETKLIDLACSLADSKDNNSLGRALTTSS
jgi:hypothetical protein